MVLYFGSILEILKDSNRKENNNKNLTMTGLYSRPVKPKSQGWWYLGSA